MSDQQVREIQLGGKQLVFLFMASVVVAVAIFLLGVSVGRGVRSASADTPVADAPTEVSLGSAPAEPADLPPETRTTPEDFQYHNQLQGTTTPPAAAQTAPPESLPAPAAESSKPSPSSSPVETAAASEAAAPPARGGHFVQVNAFRSRENADRQAAQLRSKGYANAGVAAGTGGLYRVRVGPFSDRSEAARTADRLRTEEGFKPSIQP